MLICDPRTTRDYIICMSVVQTITIKHDDRVSSFFVISAEKLQTLSKQRGVFGLAIAFEGVLCPC